MESLWLSHREGVLLDSPLAHSELPWPQMAVVLQLRAARGGCSCRRPPPWRPRARRGHAHTARGSWICTGSQGLSARSAIPFQPLPGELLRSEVVRAGAGCLRLVSHVQFRTGGCVEFLFSSCAPPLSPPETPHHAPVSERLSARLRHLLLSCGPGYTGNGRKIPAGTCQTGASEDGAETGRLGRRWGESTLPLLPSVRPTPENRKVAASESPNHILSSVSDYDYFSVSGDQEADQQEFDKSSTIPRNSDISQSYRRMFQAKRPASTAGLPTTLGPAMVTPGVATIRRTPSTKPSVRRGTIGAGPIPIKTPVIPVKTPTVPDLPGVLPAPPDGPEERGEHSPESPSVGEGPQGVTSMPSSMWSGQASVNPPLPGPKPSIPEEHRQAIPESEAEDQERDPASATASPGQIPESDTTDLSPRDTPQGEDMLNAIRRGVKLKKTTTNDRSAPRFS